MVDLHSGFGFIVSKDLVDYIASSDELNVKQGSDEEIMYSWLKETSILKGIQSDRHMRYYDEPWLASPLSHGYIQDTLIIRDEIRDDYYLRATTNFFYEEMKMAEPLKSFYWKLKWDDGDPDLQLK